jgi:hypothetical protein
MQVSPSMMEPAILLNRSFGDGLFMQRAFIPETHSKNLPIAHKTHLKNISREANSPLKNC